MCPTAPDTLRVYPFKNSDPFVITQKNDLDLNECEDSQLIDKKDDNDLLYSQVPHVYFAGNMQEYQQELIWREEEKHLNDNN